MQFLRKFLRQNRDYFRDNQADIQQQNNTVLRVACAIYLGVLAAYTVLTVVTGQSRLLAKLYYVYDAIHIVLCLFVFCGKLEKPGDARRSTLLRVLFEISLLSFFIVEAVFPFPDIQSTFFSFPIILLVMIFIYPVRNALLLIFSYVSLFVLLTCFVKDGTAQRNDLYLASGTLISAIAGFGIVTTLRYTSGELVNRLRYLSTTDSLTGLSNKQTFETMCRAFIEDSKSNRSYALLFLDIDRFKAINDRFGHQVGDAVLKGVGGILREAFYEKDYLCRFGGDEFTVLMVDVYDQASVNERVETLRSMVAGLSQTLKTDDLTFSVGVAMKLDRSETFSSLFSRADAALFIAKRNGRREASFAEQYFKQNVFMGTEAALADGAALPPTGDSGMPFRRFVLIVDDNDINRQVLRKILSDDYEVLEAVNGQEAMHVLHRKHEQISVVLLDIIMPVMDGYTVLEQMRRSDCLAKIPVIVTTASTETEAEVKSLALGANDFIVKPYRPAIILHRVKNTIHLRETASMVNTLERDSLTGLYNKTFFYEKAEQRILDNPDSKYDIICCDIDRFKLINELFGEKTGDDLLRYIADLLEQDMQRNGAGVCGRIGPDQFASLIPHRTYNSKDFAAAEQLVNQFPINISIKVHYGVYAVEDAAVPVSTMCDRALTACKSAKGKYGTYFAFYDDAFLQRVLSEKFLLDSMQTAITEKQFHVYYQPKYSLALGEPIGAEALVRWIHPERGFMSPGEFIPIFERNGCITDLDRYVWETVCQDMHGWLHSGDSVLPVSVNVSRVDIYNPELPNMLTSLVKKYNLPPKLLHLEITETAYTEDPEQLVDAVNKLHEQGFIIEMDDFGSGYSSLHMLAELPVDMIKLDMSLIREIADLRKRSVLSSITQLAQGLSLPVVAEGVETQVQATLLRDMGCNFAQGYLFSKPLPLAEFTERLRGTQSGGRI